MTSDDDDIELSYSQRFNRADPKRDALKRELEKRGLNPNLAKDVAAQHLKLRELKAQVEGQKDSEKKRREQNEKTGGFKTLTREEKIKQDRLTSDEKPSADQLVEQGKADQKAEDKIKEEEVQGEGG